jgi:PBSX family phage terminase large subunit
LNTNNPQKPLLSKKQAYCLSLLKNGGLKRLNILQGSVRSGKTYVSLILWGFWVALSPKEDAYLMAGKTLLSLKRNVLVPMQNLFGEDNFSFSLSKKEGELFGRKVYFEGASDVRSEGKIRGMTLMGAYCDELSLFEEEFFVMLLSRLSQNGAKLIATTNPDHPRHWLKAKYLDNAELDLLNIRFRLEDNVFLDQEYVKNLKQEYTGMYYDRFVLGEWVAAQGLIYHDFSEHNILSRNAFHEKLQKNPLLLATVGVDFGGNQSASVFSLVGFDRGFQNVYVLEEYYDNQNKSAEHLISAFQEKIKQWKEKYPVLYRVYCDSAEQLLVKSFRTAVPLEVKNALKKPVNTRIKMLCRLIGAGRFFVLENCKHAIEAIRTAVWDGTKGPMDVRLDDGSTDIDSLDAMEYAIERFEKELFRM